MFDFERPHPIPGVSRSLTIPSIDRIRHFAWSPDGRTLAVAYIDHSLRLWDLSSGAAGPVFAAARAPILCVAWSPTGGEIATFAEDKVIYIWDRDSLANKQVIQTQAEGVLNLAWSGSGQHIRAAITAGKPPKQILALQSWDSCTGRPDDKLEDTRWDECYPAMSADRRILGMSLRDKTIEVWDVGAMGRVFLFNGAFQKLHSVAVAPSKKSCALGLPESIIQIESPEENRPGKLFRSEGDLISLDFSFDGKLLAAKSRDGHVYFWDCTTWRCVGALEEPDWGLDEVEIEFAPESSRIATYHSRNTGLRIWSIDHKMLVPETPGDEMITILFLAADPTGKVAPLQLRREARDIEEQLRMGTMRGRFKLHLEMAARPRDISGAMLRLRPQVVHFSGHGSKKGQLFAENDVGEGQPIDPAVLAELFQEFSGHVKCVILNACHSKRQAKAIAQHVDYVIGMESAIRDKSALAFSVGFYQALGEGCGVEQAYRLGRAQMGTANPEDRKLCTLITRKRGADA
jgi:hypothetical protein